MRSVFLPESPDELWKCLDDNPRALLYAGGTDLLVAMRAGTIDPPALICLERIPELKEVAELPAAIRVGACTTHAQLLQNSLVKNLFPLLIKALQTIGSPLIRQSATIGGNICNASPAGDSLPPLYILNAEVELCSRKGRRTLPICEFITGPRQIQLGQGEVLWSILLPKKPEYNIHHFEKVGLRKSLACSIVSMAALLQLSPQGIIEAARFAWGSIGPTVFTSSAVEQSLIGKRLTPETLEDAAGKIRQAVSPIDDVRARASYRRTVSGNLLLRLSDYASLSQTCPSFLPSKINDTTSLNQS